MQPEGTVHTKALSQEQAPKLRKGWLARVAGTEGKGAKDERDGGGEGGAGSPGGLARPASQPG